MASEQDAARARVLAARADFDREYQALDASTREAVDIPAKIRRNPAKAAAVAGGLGFLVVGGPWRVLRGARRLAFGSAKPLPKSMLPEEIEKTLKKMGSDGDKVRGTLERDFADYARKAQRDRRQVMLAVLLPFVRPIAARGAKAIERIRLRSRRADGRRDRDRRHRLGEGERGSWRRRRQGTGRSGDAIRAAGSGDEPPDRHLTKAASRRGLDSGHGRVAEWQTRRP